MEVDTASEVLAANTAEETAGRLVKLRQAMERRELDVLFVGLSTDLEYLAGVERPVIPYGRVRFWAGWVAGAVIGRDGTPVLLAPRHLASGHLNEGGAPMHNVELRVVNEDQDPLAALADAIRSQAGREPQRIGVNQDAMAELVLAARSAFPSAEVTVAGGLLAGLRAVKSAAELDAMTTACALVDRVFEESLGVITSEMTELELARWIDDRMVELGAVAPSFLTGIWTMGPQEVREAKERISRRPIGTGTALNFDYGAGLRGYCSDFGRTVFMGEAPQEYREAYELVIACQSAGAEALRPGARASAVDSAARRVIQEGGYGEYFWHRLGHAIGKDTHEAPFLDVVDDTPLEEGMTFTVEPSIFIPGRFGCRVEDIFVVTPNGGRRLNTVDASMRTL